MVPVARSRGTLLAMLEDAPDRRYFPLTRWSLLSRAKRPDAALRRQALDELARAYWWPLHCFVARGGQSDERAMDLVQGFFLSLLEKDLLSSFDPKRGKFRTFLLACLKGYLGDERDRERALKRGGGKEAVRIDTQAAGGIRELPGADLTPDEAYERAWAIAQLDRAVAAVKKDLEDKGEAKAVVVLAGYLESENLRRPGTADLAAKAGLPETTTRHLLEYVRKRLKRTLLEQLMEETEGKSEAEDEVDWLFERLGRR